MTDNEAVALAKSGDEEAFRVLYENHVARVRSRCYKAVHSREDAEDLTQDVFLRVFSRIKNFRGDSAFGTWIYQITTNRIRDGLRRFQPTMALDDPDLNYEPLVPANQLVQVQVREALERLTDKTRVYVDLAAEGYAVRDLAELEQRGRATIHQNLRRARKQLREEIL